MKFVYLGETEVSQGDLETFLTAAKYLEIKGLSDNEIEGNPEPRHKKMNNQEGGLESLSDRACAVNSRVIGEYDDEKPLVDEFRHKDSSSEMLLYEDSSNMKNETGKYPCDKCEYQADGPVVLKRHKQAKHEGVKLQCNFCERAFSFKSNLNRHQKKAHSGID